MTNQEILQRAIQKAIEGGWFMDCSKAKDKWRAFQREYTIEEDGIHSKTYDCQECFRAAYEINAIIFDHDFAKALWGGKFINPVFRDDTGSKVIAINQTAWKHHLRQMVIAEDPIKYLGEYLDD